MSTMSTKLLSAMTLALIVNHSGLVAVAASVTPAEISELQSEIQNRKAQIETIATKLEEYKQKIAEYSRLASTLQNDIAIIENEMAITELDIAATQNAIEEENLHVAILDANIAEADTRLAREKDQLNKLLFEINKQDKHSGTFTMIIGAQSFNELFSAAVQLQSVSTGLRRTLVATKQARDDLDEKKIERQARLDYLSNLQVELDSKVGELDAKISAKQILNFETRESELEYRVLMSELRQEQQGISQRIDALQQDIEKRLAEADDSGDTTVISWPVMGRITTTFYDPTYPFRYLFEHGGLDIAVPQGTPIEAAAPGYVAWATTGRQYGNYVMIIHANGFATLYAHMSRIDVAVDQFVARGAIIGLSGGRPGTQGAGFSTGPHVHFELRKNGIPVNPMTYLP